MKLNKLNETVKNPSGWDSLANYIGEVPDDEWLVCLTRNRDSDIITESNWEVAIDRLGGESDDVRIDRFGHWACGWWEALSIRAGTESEKIATEISESIENYPILCEDHYSRKEMETADRVWKDHYSASDRIEYLRENPGAEWHSFGDLLQCVRGLFAPFCDCGYDGLIR